MSRRSTRLLSGGYYHSDEESDSSSVTTISYRENPVKVFKKSGGRKSGGQKRRGGAEESPGSSTGTAEASPGAPPSDWSPVPRPALRSPATPPCRPSPTRSRPVLHFQLQGESAPTAVDSSGYSSSDDQPRRPSSSSGDPRGVSREWLNGAMSRLKDAVTAAVNGAVGAVQSGSSRVAQLARSRAPPTSVTPVTGNSSSSARMKKLLCGLLLLLIFFGVWWTSLLSGLSLRTGPSLTSPAQSAAPLLTALDAASVSAAVEAKMLHIQTEMQLRHDRLIAELKQQVQLDVQTISQRSSRDQEQQEQKESRAEQRLAEVRSSLQKLQAHSERTTASLLLRMSALEDHVLQVSQVKQSAAPLPAPQLTPELEQALGTWLSLRLQEQAGGCETCDRPLADKMADFALESQGASVVSTRCSETYRTRSACVTLFGLPLWYPSESPRTVIQGPAVLLPGKCWAFHGVQGTLVIALSHPIHISHVTLDHLPRHSSPTGRIQSAPKDFQVYGMTNETEEGTVLGTFRYQEDGAATQTFSLSDHTDAVYRMVELRVLSNWGHVEYTCVYRFRVHGQMSSTEEL